MPGCCYGLVMSRALPGCHFVPSIAIVPILVLRIRFLVPAFSLALARARPLRLSPRVFAARRSQPRILLGTCACVPGTTSAVCTVAISRVAAAGTYRADLFVADTAIATETVNVTGPERLPCVPANVCSKQQLRIALTVDGREGVLLLLKGERRSRQQTNECLSNEMA